MPSYYFPGLNKLAREDTIWLENEEFHHLKVTKRRQQEPILLNSGAGFLARAELLSITSRAACLKILEITEVKPPEHQFAIAFSLLKNRHDELLVEKCTELGATKFFPMQTQYSVRQGGSNTVERFARLALAAIKQCDNPWLPKVNPVLNLEDALREIGRQGFTPVLCSERRDGVWIWQAGLDSSARPCFLIGPEGGWGEDEYGLFTGLRSVTLGSLITRAETAAIAAAAQWVAYANQAKTMGTT